MRASKSKDIKTPNASVSGDSDNDRRDYMSTRHASPVESDSKGDLGANI